MIVDNKSYARQILSINICIFSLNSNKLSVLLVKKKKEPYSNTWSLPEVGLINKESCEQTIYREIKNNFGFENFTPHLTGVYSDPKRDKRFRNISLAYYTIVDENNTNLEESKKRNIEADWFEIDQIPDLAFDNKEVLINSIELLKDKLYDIPFISKYIKQPFTLTNLQSLYESVLDTKLDKRNFRRKLLTLNCLVDTGRKNTKDSHKKSSLFKFSRNIKGDN